MISAPRVLLLSFLTGTIPLFGAEEPPLQINLRGLIAMALAESQELKNSRFELHLIRMRQSSDLQPYLPSVSFSFSDSGSVIYGEKDRDHTSIRVSLKQAVLQGGRGISLRRLRKIEMMEALNKISKTAHELMEKCYSAYYRYLFEQEKVRLREEALEAARRQQDISGTEYKIGKIREIDFLAIGLKVRETEINLKQQQTAFKDSAYRISRLAGLDFERPFKITGELPENYQGLNLAGRVDELIRRTLEWSPRVQSELLNMRKHQVQKTRALFKWLPDLTLNASALFTGNGFPLQHVKYEMGITISLPFPLFPVEGNLSLNSSLRRSSGETRTLKTRLPDNISYAADLSTASGALSHSLWNYQDSQKELERLVRQAVERYERRKDERSIAVERVDIQKQRMDIFLRGIEIGSSTRLEYLKARSDYLEQILILFEETLNLMLAERALEIQSGFPFRFFDQWETQE